MRKSVVPAVALALAVAALAGGEEVARPRKATADLPAAWQAISGQQRLAAKRVAEVDADRLLTERIYGLRINANTLVLDLALASDEVQGAVEHEIKGIRTKEEAYTDDLTVDVVREVTLREVIETLKRTVRRTKKPLGVKEEELTSISQYTKDTVLGVMGNGAIPDTKGHRMIQAKRAAEMDAYRKLAERVVGIRLSADTRVSELVLASDEIATHLAACLKGAKTTDIVYNDDGTCDVTMRLIIREVIETVKSAAERYQKGSKITEEAWRKVATDVRDKVIEETGSGAERDEGFEGGGGGEGLFSQEVTIVRVVSREVGVLE